MKSLRELYRIGTGPSSSHTMAPRTASIAFQQKYTDAKLGETLVWISNEQNYVSLLVLTGEVFETYGLQDYM